MKNRIEDFRKDLLNQLASNPIVEGEHTISLSYSQNYRLETLYRGYFITQVEIFEQETNEKIFEFYSNDDRFLFEWLTKGETEYLICAEDLYGGQTVIDLTNRKMTGFAPTEEGFICTNFYLSPNGNILATIGCYWACPFVIRLFDFSEPMNLPLPMLKEIDLMDNDETIIGWIDNNSIHTKGIERIREVHSDGIKIISETPKERILTV